MKALAKAIEIAGGTTRLADELGVRQSAVSNWACGVRRISAENCQQIERVTHGVVRAESLRPDVSWIRIPDPTWPHSSGRPLVDLAPAKEAA